MLYRVARASALAATSLLLVMGPGAAAAETQPADLGNVANADRGASLPGPHCHFVVPADGRGKYDRIITGAAHQAHFQTGVPVGVFQLTAC